MNVLAYDMWNELINYLSLREMMYMRMVDKEMCYFIDNIFCMKQLILNPRNCYNQRVINLMESILPRYGINLDKIIINIPLQKCLTDNDFIYFKNASTIIINYDSNITDIGLSYIKTVRKLVLCGQNYDITDKGISYLTNVEELSLRGTKFTLTNEISRVPFVTLSYTCLMDNINSIKKLKGTTWIPYGVYHLTFN